MDPGSVYYRNPILIPQKSPVGLLRDHRSPSFAAAKQSPMDPGRRIETGTECYDYDGGGNG